MFTAIFTFELKYWFKQPSTYIYLGLVFVVSALGSAGSSGLFDSHSSIPETVYFVNSPLSFYSGYSTLNLFLIFSIPIFFGGSLYRDYKSRCHFILYSFPFSKKDYLAAKFGSAFIITSLLYAMLGLGFILGCSIPGVNQKLLTSFDALAYFRVYLEIIIPNIFVFGALVFLTVSISRSIYSGFITILILFLLQLLLANVLADFDQLQAIFDPFGKYAIQLSTKYWTVEQVNHSPLPFSTLFLWNRICWLSISIFVIAFLYRTFNFSQTSVPLFSRNKKSRSVVKLSSLEKPTQNISRATLSFSTIQNIKNVWYLSKHDFRFILGDWSFRILALTSLLFGFFALSKMNEAFGVSSYPVTWKMLELPIQLFSFIISVITFLYAGMLIHRARNAGINHLIDSTPVPNWVFLFSKFIALIKVQMLLLSLIMFAGIAVQLSQGYYHLEIGLYLFELFVVNLITLVLFAALAFLVHSIISNTYLGFFLLLFTFLSIPELSKIGIDQLVFKFNMAPTVSYSDLDTYGSSLAPYFTYKLYWGILSGSFLLSALLFWERELTSSLSERVGISFHRFRGKLAFFISILFGGFIISGVNIYSHENNPNNLYSALLEEQIRAQSEIRYKMYEKIPQPKITSVFVEMDLFPEFQSFEATGFYTVANKTLSPIDTLLISYDFRAQASLIPDAAYSKIVSDSLVRVDILLLHKPLNPGDSLKLYFKIENYKNTLLNTHSAVKSNGTFLQSTLFPRLGYRNVELDDNDVRRKYNLPEKGLATDSSALNRTSNYSDSDWIDFETIVSTTKNQTAISAGNLLETWTAENRAYYHYKTDSKIRFGFSFNSGRYSVKKDTSKNVAIEIYYHQNHSYNLEDMIAGLKASLEYNTTHFGPFQHKQIRIVELPKTYGTFATVLGNVIPYSEALGFIINTSTINSDGVNIPFTVSAHETSHFWWGKQVKSADVPGSTMLSESLAEYVSLKVLEKVHGKDKMETFLKYDMDLYLKGRSQDTFEERPLMFALPEQDYITYRKGALVFYALSDYLGENVLNDVLKSYFEKVKFQEAPFTTSTELVNYIRKSTPDSLQYLIKDLFETITFYDNRITSASVTHLKNGFYQVDVSFNITKYRSDKNGRMFYSDGITNSSNSHTPKNDIPLYSLPLNDYIEIGIMDLSGKLMYLRKHNISKINNELTFVLETIPGEIAIDPFHKLIELEQDDNRQKF